MSNTDHEARALAADAANMRSMVKKIGKAVRQKRDANEAKKKKMNMAAVSGRAELQHRFDHAEKLQDVSTSRLNQMHKDGKDMRIERKYGLIDEQAKLHKAKEEHENIDSRYKNLQLGINDVKKKHVKAEQDNRKQKQEAQEANVDFDYNSIVLEQVNTSRAHSARSKLKDSPHFTGSAFSTTTYGGLISDKYTVSAGSPSRGTYARFSV